MMKTKKYLEEKRKEEIETLRKTKEWVKEHEDKIREIDCCLSELEDL